MENIQKIEVSVTKQGYSALSFLLFCYFRPPSAKMSYHYRAMDKYPGEFHITKGNQVHAGLQCRRTSDLILHLEDPPATEAGFTFGIPAEGAEARRQYFLPSGDRIGPMTANLTSPFLEACRIVTMCEIIRSDGRHVIKACFQHPATKDVVFLSACNNYIGEEARVPAKAEGWYVCTANVVAPGRFWREAKGNVIS
jgi:hypothetical protein